GLHPRGRARGVAGQEGIEATAGLDPANAFEVLPVPDRPELLAGLSKSHPKHIGPARTDKVANATVIFRWEVSVVPTHDLHTRVKPLYDLYNGAVLLVLGPKNKEPEVVLRRRLRSIVEKIGRTDALGQGMGCPATGKHDRHTVRVD